jgi:hypothetical protein
MKLRFQQITSTPLGLRMGVQIHGPKDSWVRFGVLEVPWGEIPPTVVDEYWKYMDRDERAYDVDQALPLDYA